MKDYIRKLVHKENLTTSEIEDVLHSIMSGGAVEQDIKEFLIVLNEKGPTVDEITGAAQLLRKFSIEVKPKDKNILDTCGTGGDDKHTFNISTITALVAAAAGAKIAKHGNRSVSSKCGSADILEGLGVNITTDPEMIAKCIDQVGIGFLFAQKLHPAMKNVAAARKALGVKTIYNILGPLINPARATHQLMGVYTRELVEPIAHVLANLGAKRALVVHGADGIDEVTTTDKTFVAEFNGEEVITYDIDPKELGIPQAVEEDLKGGDLEENIGIVNDILDGVEGPKRDIVVINAAYALYAAEKVETIEEGIQLAHEAINTGKAKDKLDELIAFTNR